MVSVTSARLNYISQNSLLCTFPARVGHREIPKEDLEGRIEAAGILQLTSRPKVGAGLASASLSPDLPSACLSPGPGVGVWLLNKGT